MILLKGSSRIVLKAKESPVYTCMTLLYNSGHTHTHTDNEDEDDNERWMNYIE